MKHFCESSTKPVDNPTLSCYFSLDKPIFTAVSGKLQTTAGAAFLRQERLIYMTNSYKRICSVLLSLLMLAKAGKYNGYLLEGMGCPGGCIGGAGTIADPARTAVQLNKYIKEAPFTDPEQSAFMSNIHVLKDDPDFEL